jgi:PAS domain S-box-containing protein
MTKPDERNAGRSEEADAPRHDADEAATGSDRPFRTMFGSAIDGIVVADSKTRRFYTANAAFCRTLGYTHQEIKQIGVQDVHPQDSLPFVMEQFKRLLNRRQSLARDIPVKRKNDEIFYADITCYPITLAGKSCLMGFFCDVTERKLAEDHLRDTESRFQSILEQYWERMSQAEQLASMGALSAMIAHEVTQPLTVSRLSLQEALAQLDIEGCSQSVVETLHECLEGISDAARRVERFRNFARQSSNEAPREVRLPDVLKRAVQLLKGKAQARRLSLTVRGTDTLPSIYANEKDVEQMCFALIENAIQAADGKRQRSLIIVGRRTQDGVMLSFEDTCGGIAPEHVDKIFQPFFTTKPPGEGTGLGLCIVERVVMRARGKIHMENRPGDGVTFCITLPPGAAGPVALWVGRRIHPRARTRGTTGWSLPLATGVTQRRPVADVGFARVPAEDRSGYLPWLGGSAGTSGLATGPASTFIPRRSASNAMTMS